MLDRYFIYNPLIDGYTELKNNGDIDYLEENFNYRWLCISDDLHILTDGHFIVGFKTNNDLKLEELSNDIR